MQRDAARLLESTGADLALFPNYLAPLASPCPYVTVVHDLAIYRTPQFFTLAKRAVLGPLLPIVTRGAAAVATVSEASRADIRELLAVPDAAHPDAARRAAPRLPAGRRGGDRRSPGAPRPAAPVRSDGRHPGAAQEPAAAAAGLRQAAGAAGWRAVRPGRGRRQRLGRRRAARGAGAPDCRRGGCACWATCRRTRWWPSTAGRSRWPTRPTSRGSACRWSRRWPAARPWW